MSLVEVTMVIGIMLTLASIITYSIGSMTDWKKGRSASEQLKSVYIAQKSYMADHPTTSPSSIGSSDLIPYLPGNPGSMPEAQSLNDEDLDLKFTVMPPVFELGGTTYDPSDSAEDGLWDVGGL